MNILDMEPDAFEGALKEMGLEPEREQFLRDDYAKKNTLSGQMLGAFQEATAPAEGMERASVLPMVKPEGMSGIEAIRSGKAELALPGFLTGAVEGPLRAMTTSKKMVSGIATTPEEKWQAAQMGAGLGIVAVPTSKLFSKKSPPKPTTQPKLSFNNTLFDEADFETLGEVAPKPKKIINKKDYEAEINLMLGEELTPEQGLASIKKSNSEYLTNSYAGSILGESSLQKEKLFSSLKDSELFKLAEDLPHWEDSKYGDYLDNIVTPIAKYQGVEKGTLLELLNDISAYLPPKENPQLANLAEKPLPKKAPVGERAAKESEPRPSDAKAEALGFKDTVYHTSVSPDEFTKFDLDKGFIGQSRSAQDLLGVHVGTARAAAERNFQVVQGTDTPSGFTMELRAKTTDPVTKDALAKMFGYDPEDIFSSGKTPLTEEDIGEAMSIYEDMLFKDKDRPDNARELAAIAFRRELAREGFTHIPYINNVEDAGSTSLIMLVDRPKGSSAVLRDVRAKFDPKKADNPDLRFAEGGMVEDEEMNRLMAEGGITDDGMNIEPVTGNEVPPGSLASEVRDDIPAKLSEGEYVVPADVVRFFGVRYFEELRMQAKQGLAQMDADGRIGGATVNANGVPMEEDDDEEEELSPEEEQMLMEALGSGMAYGGVVKGMAEGGFSQRDPAFGARSFDRANFSLPQAGGIETRVYYNPSTKEKKGIQFVGGNPVGAIPAGFVPYTDGMENQAPVTPVATAPAPAPLPEPSQDSSGGGSGMTAPTGTGQGSGINYDKWVKENKTAIMSDPYQFGLDALADTSGKMAATGLGVAGIATGNPFALLGAGGVKGYNAGQNIAEARAALQIMDAQGMADTKEYKSLEKQINKAVSDLPGLTEFAVKNFVAQGNNYAKPILEEINRNKPTSPTNPAKPGLAAPVASRTPVAAAAEGRNAAAPTPVATSSRDRQDGSWSTPSTSSSSSGQSLVGNKPTGSSTVSSLMNAVKEKEATKPSSKPTTSSRMTGGAGRAEGGLVEKGAKPKRKGLASK